MTMAGTAALVYLGPCERWEGQYVNIVKNRVVQTSAAIHIACNGISTSLNTAAQIKRTVESLHVVTGTVG